MTSGGQAFHTNLVRVNPDDTLIGVMTLTGQSGSSFSYTSQFQGINGTVLPVQNIASSSMVQRDARGLRHQRLRRLP